MNKIILIIVIGFFLQIHAQGINWQSFEEDTRNIFSLNAGLEYGTSYNITYQRKTQVFSNHPIIPGIDLTIPFGRKLFDDWKIRINGLTPIWQNEKLSFDVNPGFIVRRYKTGAARIYNLGLDV